MSLQTLMVANRGEIAIRVIRAAAEMGIRTVAVFSEDDARSLHVSKADLALKLKGSGPTAYLDIEQIIQLAKANGCTAIHPGYGFLSESARFARSCAENGIAFIGPRPEILELFGDKIRARTEAARLGIPVLAGSSTPVTLDQAREFMSRLPKGAGMMIKAAAGGGGRGMRAVFSLDEIEHAFERCRSEARAAFGDDALYVEALMPRARHIEVQIAGDGQGAVTHLWERECSIQRRYQKLVEIAPAPGLPPDLRERLVEAACRLAAEVRYNNLGTFEFLVDVSSPQAEPPFVFIEANPRLQVEHTVTEEILDLDLVKLQLSLASGATLAELGIAPGPISSPRGFAIEARVNLESIGEDGSARPSGGTLGVFEPPSGPGIRVDTYGYAGYSTNPRFDSLLAKVIAHVPISEFRSVVAKLYRALCEFRIEGVTTNLGFLQNLLSYPDFVSGELHTNFIAEHLEELIVPATGRHRKLFFAPSARVGRGEMPRLAGTRLDSQDPLAILDLGRKGAELYASEANGSPMNYGGEVSAEAIEIPEGMLPVTAPMQGTIVAVEVGEGEKVGRGRRLFVMEAMKMEHVISAPVSGTIARIMVAEGDAVSDGYPLAFIAEGDGAAAESVETETIDLSQIRPDLAEVLERHRLGLDAARPEAVERRRRTGQRTARENIEDLCDPGTFVEYGPLMIAAQRRRRSVDELIRRTPADGLVAGIGCVNGELFGRERTRCVVLAYDYTVLAGTQGAQNHRKKDRMFELAEKWRLPVVLFAEGGGGRPGDTDGLAFAGLDTMAFHLFGRLSGLVPLVGITSGRCFAGNAALLGCCDVVIATRGSNIGMGGPAMVEAGGLGAFRPEEIGPLEVQVRSGVVDIAVADEAEAVSVAKKYLSYFQGRLEKWECADQRLLRTLIPENRLRVYDVRRVIETLADSGSVLELRRSFGPGMVTALVRIEGRPLGVVANNPAHLAGAIDSNGADKAARFMQLCDAFGLPLLFLCDTPGIMVGPEAEKTGQVRHAARMFVTGANLRVPCFTIVIRKGYGLGAQAMAAGSFKAPFFTVSWPTGEFGGMNLEGAVKLGYRKELAAVQDPAERKALFDKMVAKMYESGKALNVASHFEFDDVIDPAESRKWVLAALDSVSLPKTDHRKPRPCVDTW